MSCTAALPRARNAGWRTTAAPMIGPACPAGQALRLCHRGCQRPSAGVHTRENEAEPRRRRAGLPRTSHGPGLLGKDERDSVTHAARCVMDEVAESNRAYPGSRPELSSLAIEEIEQLYNELAILAETAFAEPIAFWVSRKYSAISCRMRSLSLRKKFRAFCNSFRAAVFGQSPSPNEEGESRSRCQKISSWSSAAPPFCRSSCHRRCRHRRSQLLQASQSRHWVSE
jgi:hypothetical protein